MLGYTEGGVVLRPDRDAPLYLPNPIYGAIGDVTFVDLLHGWATGRIARGPQAACQQAFPYPPCRDVILATKDGGRSWSIIREVTTTGVTGYTFHGLQFVDVRHGWTVQFLDSCSASCGTQLLVTEDGGATWTVRWYTAPDRVLDNFRFVDALHGWATEGDWWTYDEADQRTTRLLGTVDGGATWSTQLQNVGVVDITALDAAHAWALARAQGCGSAGCPVRLYRTTDGKMWSLAADHLDAHACAGSRIHRPLFLDADRGILATGGREATDRGGVLVTGDGGRTWTCAASQPATSNAASAALRFGDSALVVARDQWGSDHLYATSDLGATWTEMDLSRRY